jgi:hypothetical protein
VFVSDSVGADLGGITEGGDGLSHTCWLLKDTDNGAFQTWVSNEYADPGTTGQRLRTRHPDDQAEARITGCLRNVIGATHFRPPVDVAAGPDHSPPTLRTSPVAMF